MEIKLTTINYKKSDTEWIEIKENIQTLNEDDYFNHINANKIIPHVGYMVNEITAICPYGNNKIVFKFNWDFNK